MSSSAKHALSRSAAARLSAKVPALDSAPDRSSTEEPPCGCPQTEDGEAAVSGGTSAQSLTDERPLDPLASTSSEKDMSADCKSAQISSDRSVPCPHIAAAENLVSVACAPHDGHQVVSGHASLQSEEVARSGNGNTTSQYESAGRASTTLPQAVLRPETSTRDGCLEDEEQDEEADVEPDVEDLLAVAHQKVQEVLKEQLTTCSCARQHFVDELDFAFGLWESTGQPPDASDIRDKIGEALSDGNVLEDLLDHVQSLGLPLARTMAWDRLKCMRCEEELEGLWRCLASALVEGDRVGIAFWLQEAEQQGLSVPGEVDTAFAALKQEEADRLAKWEAEASMNASVTDARKRGDREALREIALEARWNGADPSAATAALAALASGYQESDDNPELEREGDVFAEIGSRSQQEGSMESEQTGFPHDGSLEDESNTLYVSSPNGQEHCFGKYHMVKDLDANGQPVWMQLGGERWLYSDTNGRWNIGSRKVKERNFQCSAGFIYCGEPHHGTAPDMVAPGSWIRWDEEAKQWCQDEAIIVSPNFEEVAAPRWNGGRKKQLRAGLRGSCKGARGRKGRGRGAPLPTRSEGRAPAGPEPQPRPEKPRPRARPAEPSRTPAPGAASLKGQLTRAKALRRLGLSEVKYPTAEDLHRAYRQAALRWHPDRRQNHGQEARAKQKFQEARDAFEFLKAATDPLRFIEVAGSRPSASSSWL